MKLTFVSVDFWVKQMTFHMWVILIQSVESLKRKDLGPMKRGFYLQRAFRLKLQPPLFPGFPARWPALQNLDLPVSTSLWTNSLKYIPFVPSFLLTLPPFLSLLPPPTPTPGPHTHTHTVGLISLGTLRQHKGKAIWLKDFSAAVTEVIPHYKLNLNGIFQRK